MHGLKGSVFINGHTMRQVARNTISCCRGVMLYSKQPPSLSQDVIVLSYPVQRCCFKFPPMSVLPGRYSSESKRTQISSFGDRIVVRVFARVMLTRKFCLAWLDRFTREFD